MRTKLLNLALAVTLSSAALIANAAPTYTFSILESLGGTSNNGWARSINNSGQIIGKSNNLATYWSSNNPSAPILLQSPVGYQSQAYSINNLGQIVGDREGADGGYWFLAHNQQGVVWSSPTSQTVLEAIAFSGNPRFTDGQTVYTADAYGSIASASNDSGKIVGWSYKYVDRSPAAEAAIGQRDGIEKATLWNSISSNSPIELKSLGGDYQMGDATDINNLGQIVGYSGYYSDYDSNGPGTRATLWSSASPNSPQELVALAGADRYGWASAINNNGQIVGESQTQSGDFVATLWSSANPNSPQELVALAGVGFYSSASAINNNGQIVGLSYDANSVGKATLWDGTNSPVDLNDYLNQASRDAGWVLDEAWDINDSGSIIGKASNISLAITSQAFLLQSVNPVPEADTSAMLLMGVGVMGFMARRRKNTQA